MTQTRYTYQLVDSDTLEVLASLITTKFHSVKAQTIMNFPTPHGHRYTRDLGVLDFGRWQEWGCDWSLCDERVRVPGPHHSGRIVVDHG